MMKKQGKKNVCLRHEGMQVSVKRKGDLCKWNTTSFKSLITGVPVTPRLHQQLFCSQHSNVKFSQTLGCVYGSNCVCTTEGNLFVETSNEQGFFFFVTPSRSPRLDAYSMAFCVFVSSLLADAVSLQSMEEISLNLTPWSKCLIRQTG